MFELVVREEGFEPPQVLPRQVLSLLRLPIPPFPHNQRFPSVTCNAAMRVRNEHFPSLLVANP
jgi:hypothetical protein